MASLDQFKTPGTGYQHDPVWDAVDEYTTTHLMPAARNKYHDALEHAYKTSNEQDLPNIASYPSQGKYLSIQVQITKAKNVLEVGTLGGVGTIWLASAGSDVKVTTIEVNPHHKEVAESNIAYAGISGQVEFLLGSGLDVLAQLAEEIKAGKRKPFDFVFIDADKPNNLNYFNLVVPMCEAKTCIYVDNVVRRGQLASIEMAKQEARVAGAREVVEGVGRDERVEAVVIQTVSIKNYDGFLVAVVK